jgi:hypothetical protein
MQILKGIGIDWRERRLISKLYMEQRVKVRLDQGETRSVNIGRGVRQGCCLSPILFKLYSEYLTKEVLEGFRVIKIGGQVIRTVKYVGDLVLLAREEMVLQGMIGRLIVIGRRYGMEMNVEKTKVMRISRQLPPPPMARQPLGGQGRLSFRGFTITLLDTPHSVGLLWTRDQPVAERSQPYPIKIMKDQKQLENVECLNYLSSMITNDARCTREIKSRISMAKAAFNMKKTLFTSKLDLNVRKKFVKCYIWTVMLKRGHFGK